MTRRRGAQMPAELRDFMRGGQHPARSHPCTHCGAHARQPCQLRTTGKPLPEVHQRRIATWAIAVACCPTCQVEPTTPCHINGWALNAGSVHPERYAEAERTAA